MAVGVFQALLAAVFAMDAQALKHFTDDMRMRTSTSTGWNMFLRCGMSDVAFGMFIARSRLDQSEYKLTFKIEN
jgi:hypothetical protein